MIEFQIRRAREKDAAEMLRLAKGSGAGVELDWSGASSTWIVAEHTDGPLLGAIQVFLGHPIGRIEELMLDPSMGHKLQTIVVRDLTDMGQELLRRGGAEMVTSTIPVELDDYRRLAISRGWSEVGTSVRISKLLTE